MSQWAYRSCIILALSVAAAAYSAAAQEPAVVSRIEIEGNRRESSESLIALIHTHPGGPYSEEALKRDFQTLRDIQFFQRVRLEVRDDPNYANAKIVIFHLVEWPVIGQIVFQGAESLTESEVFTRLKDRDVDLSLETPLNPTKIKKAEAAIKELESEHGHQSAVVRSTYERIPRTNGVKLVFIVDEGPLKSN